MKSIKSFKRRPLVRCYAKRDGRVYQSLNYPVYEHLDTNGDTLWVHVGGLMRRVLRDESGEHYYQTVTHNRWYLAFRVTAPSRRMCNG